MKSLIWTSLSPGAGSMHRSHQLSWLGQTMTSNCIKTKTSWTKSWGTGWIEDMLCLSINGICFPTWASDRIISKGLQTWTHQTLEYSFRKWMFTARKQVQLTMIVWRVIARWTHKLLSQACDSFFEHVTKQRYNEKMCTKMVIYWCKLKLFVPFDTWCENTWVSKNVWRNRQVKKEDEHLLHKVLNSVNTHLSRFELSLGLTTDPHRGRSSKEVGSYLLFSWIVASDLLFVWERASVRAQVSSCDRCIYALYIWSLRLRYYVYNEICDFAVKRFCQLKAYCWHMEQLDDEMLLSTIMQHSAAWRHAMSFLQNPSLNTGAMQYTMSFLCFRRLMSRHVQSLLSLRWRAQTHNAEWPLSACV